VIAIDTSALLAIVFEEAEADACAAALENDPFILISAGTLAEAIIVANPRGLAGVVANLVHELGMDVVPVTEASALRVGQAYERWGKGVHPAGLNFGDCFAYEVAEQHRCPLLFIGNDFAKTDVASAL
jgi:ribonuclease VapC